MADPMIREMGPDDIAEALQVFASVAQEGLLRLRTPKP